jgi:hypothetical protein
VQAQAQRQPADATAGDEDRHRMPLIMHAS